MERKGSSLPSLAEATIGGEKRPHDPPERRCPSCGGVLVPEWEPFPPALTAKYDKQGVWHYPACTPKCEAEIEIREWERNRRQSKVASLLARSGIPSRLNRCTFSSFDPSFSKAAAMGLSEIRAYASSWDERRSEGRGLYLCGDTPAAARRTLQRR